MKLAVEHADERADGAGGVVVLGLAEQQRAAALDVAQVHVVAERGAEDAAGAIYREHDFGLGIVPGRVGAHADPVAPAHRRQRRRLGEDLGVRADRDFQVLRPQAVGDQRLLEFLRLLRARASPSGCRRRCGRAGWRAARPPCWRRRGSAPRSRAPWRRSAKVTPLALMHCRSKGDSSRTSFGLGELAREAEGLERAQVGAGGHRRRSSHSAAATPSARGAKRRARGLRRRRRASGRRAVSMRPTRIACRQSEGRCSIMFFGRKSRGRKRGPRGCVN